MQEHDASTVGSLESVEIRRLLARQDIEAARHRCAALCRRASGDPRSWLLAAQIALRSAAPGEAIAHLQRALACRSRESTVLIELAQQFLRLGRRRDAMQVALTVADLPLTRAEHMDAVGTLLTHVGEPARAVPLFDRAVNAVPSDVRYRYNLAMSERMTGDFAGAERNLDIVLAERPEDGEAHYARSGLRRQTPERNHVAELETIVARGMKHTGAVAAEFALAKELEDLEEHSRSFGHLKAACQRQRARLQYDVAEDVRVLDELRQLHTADALQQHARPGFGTDECIFIVGLPRSGTTLVERVLGAHPLVFGAGELDAFPSAAIDAVTKVAGKSIGKRDFVRRALDLDFESLGRAYIEETRPRTGHTPRFTDKLPLNYLYAGLIRSALPRARFIFVRRHPMDNCYAMYKTLFASAYPFSYDLGDLARYYVAWNNLMQHWAALIGPAWLQVRYEDLVASQVQVSRQIVAHCGLEWDKRCLHFHASPDAVSTASAAQVRQPLYTDSVGRWRAYAPELKPLERELTAHGIDCS